MKQIKIVFLTLSLLAPQAAHAGWWETMVDWISDNKDAALCAVGVAGACSIAYKIATRCTDVRKINDKEYRICPNANLENAPLRNENLQKANLSGANLSGANLMNAQLMNANLSGANLTNAYLINANFDGANLTNAKIRTLKFQGVQGVVTVGDQKLEIKTLIKQQLNLIPKTIPKTSGAASSFTLREFLNKQSDSKTESVAETTDKQGAPTATAPITKTKNIQLPSAAAGPAEPELSPAQMEARKNEQETNEIRLRESQKNNLLESKQQPMQEGAPTIATPAQENAEQSSPAVSEESSKLKIAKTVNTLTHKNDEKANQEIPGEANASQSELAQAPITQDIDEETEKTAIAMQEEKESKEQRKAVPEQPIEQAIKSTEQQEKTPSETPAPQPIKNSLITAYLKQLFAMLPPDVALNKQFLASLKELTDMLQSYPALLAIHEKFVMRPAQEFYKYMNKAEPELIKKQSAAQFKKNLEDLFKKIRTTLWAQSDMNEWVTDVLKTKEINNNQSLINAIKRLWTNRVKIKIHALMKEQLPIADLYLYFEQIEVAIETTRANQVVPFPSIQKELKTTTYGTRTTLKPLFEPFKNTIEILTNYLDKKITMPASLKRQRETKRTLKKELSLIRTFMDEEYAIKPDDKKAMAQLTKLKTSLMEQLDTIDKKLNPGK